LAVAALAFMAGAALADPIEGDWKTEAGPTAAIGKCGRSFCVAMKTGRHAGKQIGKFKPDGPGRYTGTMTDPNADKTYSGSARIRAGTLDMTGCAFKIFCQTQVWTRL
jgi:uncharacterized protein (DUF2147 family)